MRVDIHGCVDARIMVQGLGPHQTVIKDELKLVEHADRSTSHATNYRVEVLELRKRLNRC